MQSAQTKLKILVGASFGLVFIIWLWWVSNGGLNPNRTTEKIELFDDLGKAVISISNDTQKMKNVIQQDIKNLERSEDKKRDLILKLKTKIEENYSTSVSTSMVTSTIDQVKNEEETE